MNDSKKFCRRVALSAILLAFALPVSADEVQDANALFKQKQYDQALAKVNSALAKSPKDMKARFLKAVIYAEQGRTNDAIVVFQQIISDYPNVPEPYNNLGVLYTSLGQYKKAELQFETAIRLKPNYAIAHENLGDLRLKMASDSYGYAVDADRGNSKAKGKRDEAAALSSGQPVAKGGAPGVVPHTVAVKPEPVAPEAAAKPAPVAPAVKPEPAKPVAPAVVAKPEPVKPAPVAVAPAKPVAPATPVAAAKPAPVAPAVKPEPAKPVAPAAVAKPEPVKPAPVAVSPAKPAAPAKSSDDKAAIEDSVRAWASAWSAQDSGKYLSFYSKEFNVPGGMSRTAWEGQRKDRVSKPKFIKVDIAHVKVVKTDADHATVTFQQSYASSTLNETAGKTLVMVKSGSGWLIREEKSAGGAAPAVSKISVEPTLTPADMHAPVRPSRPVMPSSPTSRARSHGATLESAEPAHVQVVGPSSPVKPGGKASGSKDDAVGAVYAWANAWSARDAKRYLSFYSRDFAIPGGQSRAEWEANREERISKPSFIRVSVDEVKVSHPDASHATVVFVQTYKSNSLNQVGAKKLMMEKTAGGWQIIEEKNL